MELLILLILSVVLLGIFFAIYKVVVSAHRSLGKLFQSQRLVWLSRVVLVILSCAVGFLFFSFSYFLSETQRVNGIPLPWAAWEYFNGYWLPFVSPVSVIVLLFDFGFGFGITHFLVLIVLFVKNKLNKKQIENA